MFRNCFSLGVDVSLLEHFAILSCDSSKYAIFHQTSNEQWAVDQNWNLLLPVNANTFDIARASFWLWMYLNINSLTYTYVWEICAQEIKVHHILLFCSYWAENSHCRIYSSRKMYNWISKDNKKSTTSENKSSMLLFQVNLYPIFPKDGLHYSCQNIIL